jgi:hypothetical protein
MASPKKGKGKKAPKSGNMLDRLEECDRGGQFELDLSGLGLLTWPEETVIVPNVVILKAFGNKFVEIPPLENFRGLDTIDFSRNCLRSMEESCLAALHRLKYLDISRNEFEALPSDITSLPLLTTLVASRCKIKSMPKEMAAMRSLKTLDLGHNQLTILGDVLDSLPSLAELDLTGNTNLDNEAMSIKTRRLHEKRQLLKSKTARMVLIKRALGIRKDVLVREQENIEKEIKSAEFHHQANPFP